MQIALGIVYALRCLRRVRGSGRNYRAWYDYTTYLASRRRRAGRELRVYYFGAREMKSYQKILAVIALSSMCLATAAASDADAVVKKTKKHSAVKTAVKPEEKH